jgi:hypothetical protein
MDLLKKPFAGCFSVTAAVHQHNGRDSGLEDIEKQERIFFIYRAGALLPSAFDYQIVLENRPVDYQEIAPARCLID